MYPASEHARNLNTEAMRHLREGATPAPAMISHEAASDGAEWIEAEMMALGAGT